jgi:hypothetical protein
MVERASEKDVPKRTCEHIRSPFESNPEWPALKRGMARGIPKGEMLRVSWTPREFRQEVRLTQRTVTRFLKRYVLRNGMLHYRVANKRRDGRIWFMVIHPARCGRCIAQPETAPAPAVSVRQRRTA